MPEPYDPNAMWVSLNSLDSNLFAVYPRLLAALLLQEEAARQPGDTSEAERLVLPSDREWRLSQYFFLVAMQKQLETSESDAEDESGPVGRSPRAAAEPPELWAPWSLVVEYRSPRAPAPVALTNTPGPAWDIAKVLKAGRLLCKPPLEVTFEDEQEMRVVYSLIYDVFRYKSILDQAINDIEFFGDFPQLLTHRNIVWLFVMELARRRWAARPKAEAARAGALLAEGGALFQLAEDSVWRQRVHFAAAIARIRIKNKAISLADLLPEHLREERISACVHKDSVTGWVNTFKATKLAALVRRLHELGFSYSASRQLCAGEYRFDRVCPRFITLRPPQNFSVGQMDLVKNGLIILQEREFCEGASTLCRLLRARSLQGAVAQSHASSPRCSAYLAAQLQELAQVRLYIIICSGSAARHWHVVASTLCRLLRARSLQGAVAQSHASSQRCSAYLAAQLQELAQVTARHRHVFSSTLRRLLRARSLQGAVAQSHASSPRCSAYLAAQLQELAQVLKAETPAAPAVPELGRLVVFGAGDKIDSYVLALREMGIQATAGAAATAGGAVQVVSDPVHCGSAAVAAALDGVVAALATPPNSYSAVTDPIDLVCGRGGDLAMLEVLTECEVDTEGKTRVSSILEEQKKTLKTLLSKPQIQVILYETHSALEAENQAQVSRAVAEANRLARERHQLLKRKHHTPKPRPETALSNTSTTLEEADTYRSEAEGLDSTAESLTQHSASPAGNPSPPGVRRQASTDTILTRSSFSRPGTTRARPIAPAPDVPRNPDVDLPDINVPDCDLFEVSQLPALGNGLDINLILERDGCFLGLIQRKEITRLDAKYMIRVAEERGLFGAGAPAPAPARRKPPAQHAPKRRRRKNSFEVERIAAPTHASLTRSGRRGSAPGEATEAEAVCARHLRRHAAAEAIACQLCACDAKHKRRRASTAAPAPAPPPSCRRRFPLVVHDISLQALHHQDLVYNA
ncbi:hypothetical protein JYU34_009311 [Plutella xylostella]|uniref:Uncharacterized protein n=1 Tax=Plutella xylostella TaxID=51655 RepID=A0ABQ7QJ74_PLUXY|nr:hypothetical protein JYU34_009311 [Plutella xylostella]